ncbi:hypothetical protein [Hoeflea poritis]|uniref:Uncharacterized protein n=1 Tax=Hoeflea poritis TaxID=2993659 RepID=A0ABT4VLJ5_9HYPH|nr:hypothetical protein [Hoeflea poritis]MDA4844972.1 hypothetical protein [Hoeflea poritis]
MKDGLIHHAVDGISIDFDPIGGRIEAMVIEPSDGTPALRPLHKAPWVDAGEDLPDSIDLVERSLAGDFFCAPFGKQPGTPIHGWTANGTWLPAGTENGADGSLTASYRLQEHVAGASVTKDLTLRPGHPFLYQCHRFRGGQGHLPVGHHAMIRVPGGARLSFSPKRFCVTPNNAPESDPERGRSVLSYPQRINTLAQIKTAGGKTVDAAGYPFDSGHEDTLVMAEADGDIGWSAALAKKDGFLFFAVKDARRLPETTLWMSNGGRSYAPWLSRHTYVLGIEETATGCHASRHFESTGALSSEGLATGLVLKEGAETEFRYGFGAVPAPAGWTEIADIRVRRSELMMTDTGGDSLTLPFDGTHFGL